MAVVGLGVGVRFEVGAGVEGRRNFCVTGVCAALVARVVSVVRGDGVGVTDSLTTVGVLVVAEVSIVAIGTFACVGASTTDFLVRRNSKNAITTNNNNGRSVISVSRIFLFILCAV